MTEHLRPLTQEQRQSAHRAARQAALRAIGPQPTREHFASAAISWYPVSVLPRMGTLIIVSRVLVQVVSHFKYS